MKANIEGNCVERESRRAVAVLLDGGVHKNKTSKKHKSGSSGVHGRKGEENTEEMKEYLGKLQELVPFMPKNKRLSKLEVISHVIDYIHDLRETLGLPPCQQTEMDNVDDTDDDNSLMEDYCDEVSNQTFKVCLAKGNSTSTISINNSEPVCDVRTRAPSPSQRLPLTSISTPRNTDVISSTLVRNETIRVDDNSST